MSVFNIINDNARYLICLKGMVCYRTDGIQKNIQYIEIYNEEQITLYMFF